MSHKKIERALISVFDKAGIDKIAQSLHKNNVEIISTGGTQKFIEDLGIPVTPAENLTDYPSILGGRVKTLHPKIFGGILNRRDNGQDQTEVKEYGISSIDVVIVDLYPFEETVSAGGTKEEIIEKIDIGGIALIRGAAKNFNDVVIVPSKDQYGTFLQIIESQECKTTLQQRQDFATQAFNVSSHYDSAIFNYFNGVEEDIIALKISEKERKTLRYGENPHQDGYFFGDLSEMFDQLHGKELSYNNLLDVDAAVNIMQEFQDSDPTFAILKHNNACGIATRKSINDAYSAALEADPVSAFGGILIANTKIDRSTADKINTLFCEVVIAPSYDQEALEVLKSKKNRIILVQKTNELPHTMVRTALNGFLVQDRDAITEKESDLKQVTKKAITSQEEKDLLFANKIAKHTKSNTIVLAKNEQLLASGTGQTSRVDALRQAIHKAKSFNFDLNGAVMASDAFFPFPDCVEIAEKEGVKCVIQPGGSIKDELSIEYCNKNDVAMVFSGHRHFKH
jgi:phosphoribosylaminoimidazolecarboxamide formyltransferase/IMP cyclohydrolase